MSNNYKIKITRETPTVDFNYSTGILSIEGRSLPENSFEFYKPIISWLKNYSLNPQKETQLIVFMEYLNSGSLKQLFKIIYLLEDLIELGHQANIIWKYKNDDELMFEKGKEFQQFLDIPIELVGI